MRSWKRLIGPVTEIDNILLAFLKASKGKRHRSSVRAFADDLDGKCHTMATSLYSGVFPWGRYREFQINEPKRRLIAAAPFPDRVAHHALMNICEPYFDSYLIYDTYACRTGKGLYKGLDRAVEFSRAGGWFLKLDIKKYFYSISHEVLIDMLSRRVGDHIVMSHFRAIIENFACDPGLGLPIGCLTSQYFANHYLGLVDHFIKEQLGCRRYVRYMDDFVLWHDDRKRLLTWLELLRQHLREHLRLELNAPVLMRVGSGLSYCGYRVFPHGLRLHKRARRRFRKCYVDMLAANQAGQMSDFELARRIEPMLSFIRRASSRSYMERLLATHGRGP